VICKLYPQLKTLEPHYLLGASYHPQGVQTFFLQHLARKTWQLLQLQSGPFPIKDMAVFIWATSVLATWLLMPGIPLSISSRLSFQIHFRKAGKRQWVFHHRLCNCPLEEKVVSNLLLGLLLYHVKLFATKGYDSKRCFLRLLDWTLAILQCSLKIQADQAHCHLYSPGMQHEPETQPIGKEIPHIPFGDILYHQFWHIYIYDYTYIHIYIYRYVWFHSKLGFHLNFDDVLMYKVA